MCFIVSKHMNLVGGYDVMQSVVCVCVTAVSVSLLFYVPFSLGLFLSDPVCFLLS